MTEPIVEGYGLPGWLDRGDGEIGPGGFPLNSKSQAYEASRVIKSGAGSLFGVTGYNSGAAGFVLIFDLTPKDGLVPANGSIPEVVIAAPTLSNYFANYGTLGRAFKQGIVAAFSSTGPTLTLGTASVWFDAQYW